MRRFDAVTAPIVEGAEIATPSCARLAMTMVTTSDDSLIINANRRLLTTIIVANAKL